MTSGTSVKEYGKTQGPNSIAKVKKKKRKRDTCKRIYLRKIKY